MAEVALGVTASAVGVAGFALQLAETVVKLKSFCNKVENAPARLQELVERIEVTSSILTELATEEPEEVGLDRKAFEGSFILCRQAVERITIATASLQRRMESKKIWTSVKYVLKSGELEDLLRELDRGKADLQLAHAMYLEAERKASETRHQAQMALQLRMLEQVLVGQAQIAQGVQIVSSQTKDLGVGCTAAQDISPFNRRRRRTTRNSPPSTLLRVRPPTMFSRRVWDICFERAAAGWRVSLSTYKVIGWDHEIWTLCQDGDMAGVQQMLDLRLVSLHDQSPWGHTLFFEAARFGHTELARFLEDKGADPAGQPESGV